MVAVEHAIAFYDELLRGLRLAIRVYELVAGFKVF